VDDSVCVSKEYGPSERLCDSSVPGLRIKLVQGEEHLRELVRLFKDYFEEVFWPDKETVEETADGPMQIWDSEKQLLLHGEEGARIECVFQGQEMVGFFIYHLVYECILMVHAIYLVPKLRDSGAAWDIVKSVGNVKKLFFQNRTSANPDKKRGKIIHQNDEHTIFEKDIRWEI
jgi:hypothetical protein